MHSLFAQVTTVTTYNPFAGGPLGIVGGLAGLVGLVCFILILIKMFQNGQTVLGIICAVGLLCGIGYLIAFVYGWMKSGDWKVQPVMLAWTVAIIVQIAITAYLSTTGPVVVVTFIP